MMTCETTTQGRGEHASSEDGASGADDAGPSRSCVSTSAEAGEPPDARSSAPRVDVELTFAPGTEWVIQRMYHSLCERLIGEAARGVCDGGTVRVRIVGDDEMASAHERFCGVPGTTDVITFDLASGESADGAELDVDLLVCVDVARREALKRRHTVEIELALYTLHGVLHALGYDDRDEASYERMHAREDEVFRALGLEDAFGRGESE